MWCATSVSFVGEMGLVRSTPVVFASDRISSAALNPHKRGYAFRVCVVFSYLFLSSYTCPRVSRAFCHSSPHI
ncbi:hypothetical protein F4813DRAFT_326042 [Daldinia decipiens]|uniref:uncharacterized protein n=1 Tax=Daldinia decipiens TaxID=326647 RepID=UPI0020C3368E|nr:uncharacterized protein F4813DRAFT_326042 [Daldinia decipiens]KAI1659822.1 hypothetical protein F4813DRAFT_326042 [Daldinia decipiens]